MLTINNLNVDIQDAQAGPKQILREFNLTIGKGEVHAIMGPNGSGKSTLANVLAGRPDYNVIDGTALFNNENLISMAPEMRAAKGLFLSFQYPIEIPGVNNMYFLRTALNAIRKHQGLDLLDAADFLQLVKAKIKLVGLKDNFLHRGVNEGFSGGEKKRNEILQMLILEPQFIILDEIDSGLDIDALQTISASVNSLRSKNRSFLLITHYQRLLDYIQPDFVHVMAKGKILKSGDAKLAAELEAKGYSWVENYE